MKKSPIIVTGDFYFHNFVPTPRYTSYGVNPKEVHGEDFPGETFRVLKEKEVRSWEYRTSRLVLEA
jgi:hypothetical protein